MRIYVPRRFLVHYHLLLLSGGVLLWLLVGLVATVDVLIVVVSAVGGERENNCR